MITDWKITKQNWDRSDGITRIKLGLSDKEIRAFAAKTLFPDNHNVGMVVVAKDIPDRPEIKAYFWQFETDPYHVWEGDHHRMTDPMYPKYRFWKKDIKGDLPCTLPIDRRNIQQCLESLSDDELTQIYNSIKESSEMEKGIEWRRIEGTLVSTISLNTYLVVSGKQYLDFPAINANIEQIMKT